ncbi:hypothetical protein EMCRGX_G022901 [Ephydatia muelleri]
MAGIRIEPPEPFVFAKPDGWPQWKRRFEQFIIASGVSEESELRKVSTLLYCLGPDAEDVLVSTNINSEERKKYCDVVKKLDDFFKCSPIHPSCEYLGSRPQACPPLLNPASAAGETVDQYIAVLHNLAENCDYGMLKSELIRDRIVVGIRDSALSQRLQLDPDLTLEKAMRVARQREAVQEQQEILREAADSKELDSTVIKHKQQLQTGQSHLSRCLCCGRDHHQNGRCPAKAAVCFKCQKKGHFARRCPSKQVEQLHTSSAEREIEDGLFIEAIGDEDENTAWFASVQLNGKTVQFKLDTGSEVTVISCNTFKTLGCQELKTSSKILYGPGKQPLDVMGQFVAKITYKNAHSQEPIFVVRGLNSNLLGLPALRALQLVARTDAISQYEEQIYQKYPHLFTGLGTLGPEYTIKLKANALPYALSTPRSVPLPLRDKVKKELDRMESMGVISRVDGPSEWPLNESVLRENFPLPKVDENLAQLSGATVFSKLDANCGFWQIPLAKHVQLLTTFITPFGRYCFTKLPFGISCAPELFQKRMSDILQDIEGKLCQMDDVLVFGSSQEEHDDRLKAVLKRIEEAGMTLNPDKCAFSRHQIKFLGHIVDQRGIQADPEKTSAILKLPTPKNIADLRRLLGMVNQFGKFSPHIAEITKPLRELLSSRNCWLWGSKHDEAFLKLKKEVTKPSILAHYNPQCEVKNSADASSFGLGAALLQKENNEWRPVAFASRQMTETEQRYAQIEKEALAIIWACDKFSCFVIVPRSLQTFTLQKIHSGHLGIQRCRLRAGNAVWWPGLAKQILSTVQNCHICSQKNPLVVEPMISLDLPAYPWQRVSSDLFEMKGNKYLLVVDSFSRYPEVIQLPSTTTSTKVISVLKSVFARHGIPEEFISDNGPQYSSQEMKEFALQYGFRHTTSSPHYPRGHGQAERAVKTVKSLLLDAEDPFLALLNYRATPFPWCGLSPAELLFGRQIRTTLPQAVSQLTPDWAHLKQFRIKEQQFKCRQKADYDRRHRTRLLSDLQHNTEVRVATEKKLTKGHVLSKANTPRSYIIETPDGRTLRRNCHHLMVVPRGEELYELQDEQDGRLEHNDNDEQEEGTANGPDPEEPAEKEVKDAAVPVLERRHIRTRSPIATRSRTGTAIRPPDRL